jgi:hypothetical protein
VNIDMRVADLNADAAKAMAAGIASHLWCCMELAGAVSEPPKLKARSCV